MWSYPRVSALPAPMWPWSSSMIHARTNASSASGQDDDEITLVPFAQVGRGIRPEFQIRTGSNPKTISPSESLELDTWTHLAVTLDGEEAAFYFNGELQQLTDISLSPLDIKPMHNVLGKHHEDDTYDLDGSIAALRVYSWALNPDEIVAPVPYIDHPAVETTYTPGVDLHLSGGADDFMGVPLPDDAMTWQVEWHHDQQIERVAEINGVADSNVMLTESKGFYRIILSASDNANRVGDYHVDLYPELSDSLTLPWTARYRFNEDAQDDLGYLDGTLEQGATIKQDNGEGYLVLDGVDGYVNLPQETGTWRSFGAWINWDGGGSWQRLLDTGSDSDNYAYVSPANNDFHPRFRIRAEDTGNGFSVEGPDALDTHEWVHVAVILEGPQAVMFVNSQAVAVTQSVNLIPSDTTPILAYLGRSLFSVDPYYDGAMDSVVISSEPLAINELMNQCEPESDLHPYP